MRKQSSNWLKILKNSLKESKELTLERGLLIAMHSPADIKEIRRSLAALRVEQRERIATAMLRLLQHPACLANVEARIGAVNTMLAMPKEASDGLKQILKSRSQTAIEVQFTVFVFMPSAVALSPARDVRRLKELRREYLERPISAEVALQAAYGMTLEALNWRTIKDLVYTFLHCRPLVSRDAALSALTSACRHLSPKMKMRALQALESGMKLQRNSRLRRSAAEIVERDFAVTPSSGSRKARRTRQAARSRR